MTGVIHAHITETSMDEVSSISLPNYIPISHHITHRKHHTYGMHVQKDGTTKFKEGDMIYQGGASNLKTNHSFGRKMNQTNRQRKVSGTIKRNTG